MYGGMSFNEWFDAWKWSRTPYHFCDWVEGQFLTEEEQEGLRAEYRKKYGLPKEASV